MKCGHVTSSHSNVMIHIDANVGPHASYHQMWSFHLERAVLIFVCNLRPDIDCIGPVRLARDRLIAARHSSVDY